MSSKLKASLEAKLARQQKALQDTADQLDWIREQEAKASKVATKQVTT